MNPNSLRKSWETYVHNKADAIPTGMRRAFRANTGHTNQTATTHYVAPMQEEAIKDFLDNQRDIIREAVYSAENQIEDDHMDIPASPGSTDAPWPQHELEVPGPSCSKTIEDDHAYTTDPLYTSASEVTLGTSDTAPKRSVNANTDSDSELSTCSTFSFSSVKTRTRIINAPGRYAKARMSSESKLEELHRKMRTFKGPRDPLQASMIRLIDLLSKVDGKLSKSEMRNLVLPMKMNLQDQEAVLNRCAPNTTTFANIWTFKTFVPPNQNLIQTFVYLYRTVLYSFQSFAFQCLKYSHLLI